MEVVLSAREAELKEVQSKAEYYVEKSTRIALFTMVKIRAKMLKEYPRAKAPLGILMRLSKPRRK